MATFTITDQSDFIDGVNYQLQYGFDFGTHAAVPNLGLHNKERLRQVWQDFALLSDHGVRSVRMNVFNDGRTGIVFDGNLRPLAVQESVILGTLSVLRAAADCNLLVSLVMLDHKFAEQMEWIDAGKPELGTKQGHGRLLLTGAGREEMLSNVFRPLLQQIGREAPTSLLSFELVNEPESLIEGLSTDPFMQMRLPRSDLPEFKGFMRAFRDLVHQETEAQFTVGSIALKHAHIWLDVLDPRLDYLSVHYYGLNHEPPYDALYGETVKRLQGNIPVVWGEYAANGFADYVNYLYPQQFSTASQFLEDALKHNIKGAYAWALRSGVGAWGDTFGPVPLDQHRAFATRCKVAQPGK